MAGERGFGLDPVKTRWIAGQIDEARSAGRELGIVIGGGNFLRGKDALAAGVPRLIGDHMGMIATVLNAMALKGALQARGAPAAVMSAFPVGTFVEMFDRERAMDYLNRGYTTIFSGGTGNPCFTTDSAAALRAVEIEAEVMIKGTQVRGVFDKDPRTHPDATFFERISPRELLERGLEVIDAACADILARNSIPAIVLDLHEEGNIARSLAGERIGTIVQ